MKNLTESKRLRGPRTAEGAILGTMIEPGEPWQTTVGGDALYALTPGGEHTPVASILEVEHGVVAQWTGRNVAEAFIIAWCPCHADHPVVRALCDEGRFAGRTSDA